MPPVAPSWVAERKWLAKAAKYIREHGDERSPVCEEFACRVPKRPPDRVAEVVLCWSESPEVADISSRCGLCIVNISETTSAMRCSHLPGATIMLPVLSPVVLLRLGIVTLSMPAVPPGAAHDIMRQWVEARASCYRSFLVIQQSEVHICQVRCEQLSTLNAPRRYGVSTVNRYAYTSAIKRSPPSGTTSMPPVWSCVVAMSLVPVVPTGAVRGILGKQTSADAPCSRSFPVILQLADDSRRYKAAHHTPPILPPVVSLQVGSRRRLGIGLVWRARDKVPDTLGTSRRYYDSVINRGGHMSAGRSPSHGAVLMQLGVPPAAFVRASASCHLTCGLGSALAPVTSVWLLHEAVSTWEREGEEGGSPFRWPAAHSFAPRHLRTVPFNSF